MKTKTLFILAAFIFPGSIPHAIAQTNIYKHVDKDGNITFTNRRIPNAEKISIASYSRNSESNPTRLQSNGNAPRIKDTTQKERDTVRRQILQKELTAEEKHFSETQTHLDQFSNNPEAGNFQEKTVQLKNKLFLHQRNITALKKELGRL
ncbi:MAG: DUF4124 domain-containing protein [Proteobacteria bacterium]|jgi:hypothetical protein|nr:DUF4124 domain-containing protein [Pseudomonadota bacterium]